MKLSRLREHFGTAGLIVAIVALVAALSGAALAANGGSGNGQATASAKAKKGPRGPKGPAGPQGPAGPAGPQGAKGDPGPAGSNGSNGADGKNGATGPTGPTGKAGKDGEPWAVGGTLPPGATETGTYLLREPLLLEEYVAGNISFPIPLEEEIEADHLIFVKHDDGSSPPAGPANCQNPDHPGTGNANNPEAAPGYLCVFEGESEKVKLEGEGFFGSFKPTGSEGADTTGTILTMLPTAPGANAWGTWAVTAPSE